IRLSAGGDVLRTRARAWVVSHASEGPSGARPRRTADPLTPAGIGRKTAWKSPAKQLGFFVPKQRAIAPDVRENQNPWGFVTAASAVRVSRVGRALRLNVEDLRGTIRLDVW